MSGRDMRPALGSPGPARWRRARKGAKVELHGDRWQDGAWSFLFKADTDYAADAPAEDAARIPEMPDEVQRGMMKAPVWTWEVPLYFWFGGLAAGSSFVALACDLAGDRRSARWARLVALGAVVPCPPLLIADLGRPLRFLNMLRIFKPRSPMSMGAWCLVALLERGGGGRRRRPARPRSRRAADRRRERRPRRLPRLLHRRAARQHRGPAVGAQQVLPRPDLRDDRRRHRRRGAAGWRSCTSPSCRPVIPRARRSAAWRPARSPAS